MKRIPDEGCAATCGLFWGGCPAYPDTCHGCLSDFVRGECRTCSHHGFKQCAADHLAERCFECGDFPCGTIRAFSAETVIASWRDHSHAIEDSLRMRELGVPHRVQDKIREYTDPATGELCTWFDLEPASGLAKQ